jgi:hypothetical protein
MVVCDLLKQVSKIVISVKSAISIVAKGLFSERALEVHNLSFYALLLTMLLNNKTDSQILISTTHFWERNEFLLN